MNSWWHSLERNAKPAAALQMVFASAFLAMAVYSALFSHWHRLDFFFLSAAFINFASVLIATWPVPPMWSRLSSVSPLARFCVGVSFGCLLCFLLQLSWATQGP
jgi:hypothetical protein